MTTTKFTNCAAAFYLLAALLLPTLQPAFGAAPQRITDVGLTSAGLFVGQVVDSRGKPVANSPIQISASGKKPIQTSTNERGYFSVDKLSAGMYVAATPGTAKLVRVWAPRTAPPAASEGVLLVQPQATARAQNGHHLLHSNWKAIAAGVAIGGGTVAILDYNDADDAS